ncbi:winged helix-turn-helix transcriptional regulator [Haloarcula amylovorans]|uniref:winged helix-turn-helix transcriptional regulator n=1 Tax=Haloarcula amylovorans TaxID=2562280 RepID=UPI0010766C01|nr:helix-turn-helix domain-containing protein [Halomicroarcula amylolytica]
MDSDGEGVGRRAGERQQLRRATAILGKKWHPILIHTLQREGPIGFNDLKACVEGISDKVLSESLDDLEAAGVVSRDVIDAKPVRVEYALTDAGTDLGPVIDELWEWSQQYLPENEAPS